jgi:small subunit ribosomal protein S11
MKKNVSEKSKKKVKKIASGEGIISIKSSFNNTILTLSQTDGKVLAQVSPRSASKEFKGAKKSTPYAAEKAAEALLVRAEEFGISKAKINTRFFGSGRDAALLKIFNQKKIEIEELADKTPVWRSTRPKKRPRK